MTNGLTVEEIKKVLLEHARERCEPPVDEKMVARIAESVAKYPASAEK